MDPPCPVVSAGSPRQVGGEICEEIGWDTDWTPGRQVNPHAQSVHAGQQGPVSHAPDGVVTRGRDPFDVRSPRRDLQLIIQRGGRQVLDLVADAG